MKRLVGFIQPTSVVLTCHITRESPNEITFPTRDEGDWTRVAEKTEDVTNAGQNQNLVFNTK